jgi:hypothetical protein
MTWEKWYVSPHIDEDSLIGALSNIVAKYLVPMHTNHPGRLEQMLPNREVLVPKIFQEYGLLASESKKALRATVADLLDDHGNSYLHTISDADFLDLIRDLHASWGAKEYTLGMISHLEDIKKRVRYLDREWFCAGLSNYYQGQVVRVKLRRALGLADPKMAEAELGALHAAVLPEILSFAKSAFCYHKPYGLRTIFSNFAVMLIGGFFPGQENADDVKLAFVHGAETERNIVQAYAGIARLVAELLFEVTHRYGINPNADFNKEKLPYVISRMHTPDAWQKIENLDRLQLRKSWPTIAWAGEPTLAQSLVNSLEAFSDNPQATASDDDILFLVESEKSGSPVA